MKTIEVGDTYNFQLPLSGSQRPDIYDFVSSSAIILSTPSLGITGFAGDSGLGLDYLSTPSLGITYQSPFCTPPPQSSSFQLPLSGSLGCASPQKVFKITEPAFNSLSRDHWE